MKDIALGVQTFATIREKDAIYVDKTEYIHRMVSSASQTFFLARPRRFGKSLMVSTLEALFTGRKELFDGLYIGDKWDFAQMHPVIRIDMSATSHNEAGMLERSLSEDLKRKSADAGLNLVSSYAATMFGEYIQELYKSTGKQVVILIDEYDCPITDVLGNSEMINANRTFLQTFYKQLKANDASIRFIFITGITKFAKLALFSTLNNPKDISLDERFAAICGYTQIELESNFSDYIDSVAQKNKQSRQETLDWIKLWYDGYSWDAKTFVYNPVSTMTMFDTGEFENYWFGTGTPFFLENELRNNDQLANVLDPVESSVALLDAFTPENLTTISLLFQTGYLTIKEKHKVEMRTKYKLAMPNAEVRESLVEYLLASYAHIGLEKTSCLTDLMVEALDNFDETVVAQCMQTVVQNVPSILHIGNEKYYHSLFVVWMLMLGFKIDGEMLTANGRIDAVLEREKQVVICEIKYHATKSKSKLLGEAMKQIGDKRYHEKYIGLGKKILLLGMSFTGAEKVVGCRMKAID